MSSNAKLAAQTLAGVAIIAAVLLFLPVFGTTAVRGVQTKNLSNAKQLGTACKLYALDHAGRFPIHLSELEPDYIPNVDNLRCQSMGRDKEPSYFMDWLYFGAGFDEANLPRVLIASPQATTTREKQTRVVIEGDTRGSIVEESAYQELLAETVRQMRAVEQARRTVTPLNPKTPAPENEGDLRSSPERTKADSQPAPP